ncbi:MAG: rod shape-determining protein RodA [Prochlorococcus sp. SP3034]|nr:rod shape-determining protein RodA [Prochlorococcus sp. SP3034]|tara:strand:- start:4612 stop:5883 length:1272 start_codon:yes stop_codon:yes gene_type:complete
MIPVISFLKKRRLSLNTKKFKFDLIFSPILIGPFILVVISSLLIESIQKQSLHTDSFNHLFTGIFGCFLAIIISYVPLERFKNYIFPFYLISILTLVLVYFFGITIYGAQRWLNLGIFTFQPSEVAKLSSLLVLALVLEKKTIDSIKDIILPIIIVSIPWTLIFFQPDLGTSLVLIFLFFTMLYWAQMPIEWILIVVLSLFTSLFSFITPLLLFLWIPFMGFLAYKSLKKRITFAAIIMGFHLLIAKMTPFLWNYGLQDYQKDRLILFLDPSRDPLGGGYHLLQSKIAIGSGGIFGTGLLNGKLTSLHFIPEQHTDFIFSALGEETGFIGSIIVIFIFFILISQLIRIAKKARTDFESLVVIGIASIFLFQIIINIYMTIGLGPVTGIPLPFMSYGRTSLLINFIFIGLALSTLKRIRSLKNL